MRSYGITVIYLIFFTLLPEPVHSTQADHLTWKRYSAQATSHRTGARLLNLTRTTYFDVGQRIATLNNFRFLHEKTPTYEQGLVFSEIIERYKKMVELYQKMIQINSIQVYESFNRVEYIQKLYFEIYHLYMMMHEIPRKYSSMGGKFKDVGRNEEDLEYERQAKEAYEKAERERELAAQLMMKVIKQKEKKKPGGATGVLQGMEDKAKYHKKSPAELASMFPKRWPHDYGWEPAQWE